MMVMGKSESGWLTAPVVLVKPEKILWHQANEKFIPICQYPLSVRPMDNEFGALVEMKRDFTITKVHKRICTK